MFWSEKPKFTLSPSDMKALEKVADALVDRLHRLDARIDALEAELAALKKERRQSLNAKLREKGMK